MKRKQIFSIIANIIVKSGRPCYETGNISKRNK